MVKGILIGAGVSCALIFVLMCTLAFVLNMLSGIPYGALDYVMIGAAGLAVLVGAYIASAVAKSRGLIVGLICAAVVLLITLACGMSSKHNDVTLLTGIRAAVLLLCGALGGIKGVNRKEKLRIK